MGIAWTALIPLLMLAVYTFVFSVVFRSRWGAQTQSDGDFALYLFSGLLIYGLFSECANAAPLALKSYGPMIKQVRFPSEVVSWTCLLAAGFQFAVGFAVFALAYFAVKGIPPASWVYLPAVLLPVALLSLGAGWILSAVGAVVEDVAQVVGVGTTALLFLSPIFYSAERIPEAFRAYYFVNPFAHLIGMSKDVLFSGVRPDLGVLTTITIGAWIFAWLSYLWFRHAKESIADVL